MNDNVVYLDEVRSSSLQVGVTPRESVTLSSGRVVFKPRDRTEFLEACRDTLVHEDYVYLCAYVLESLHGMEPSVEDTGVDSWIKGVAEAYYGFPA